MTKSEWIKQRNEKSGEPWESIIASGWDAKPCECGLHGCQGWALMFVGKPKATRKAPSVENDAA